MRENKFPQDITLGWNGSTTARCENLIGIGDPISSVGMKLNLRYQQPWFWTREPSYEFVGVLNPNDGKLVRWVRK